MPRCDRRRLWTVLYLVFAQLSACTLTETLPTGNIIAPFSDVSALMDGICFEAALAMSGQVFVLSEQEQLDLLYDEIESKGLCTRHIPRQEFDFSGGRTIAGTWTYSPFGCRASHGLRELWRDETTRTLTLRFSFEVEGDCPYELIRPLWIVVENVENYILILDIQR